MNYQVLIVDDSKLARMSVARLLSELRPAWRRLEASNADEALGAVQASSVDMVLMDFNMPGRDGLVLAAELRGLDPNMPLALISANQQDEIVASAREIGVTFLSKPLTRDALASFVEVAEARLSTADR